jgi:hypothetical protein
MNTKKSNLFWGILLIGSGVLALVQQAGYLDQLPEGVWMWVFALVSLVALVMYVLSGWREWGWLFPVGVFGGLAVTVALATRGVNSSAVGSPLFVGLLIPFIAAYLTDRSRNWWALIPGGVMFFLALTTLLADSARGEWIGSLFLFMIGFGFLVTYLSNRTHIWALLVAYIMGVLGIAPLMASGGETAAYYGPLFLFAIALPFFIIYFRGVETWWAIIPAGVLTSVSIIAALAIAGFIRDQTHGGYANAILMFGLAVTFSVIWLRHAQPWARVTTIILLALTVASILFASYSEILWPLAIILAGGYLLYSALRPKIA